MERSAGNAVGIGVEKVPRGTTESLHSCGRVMPPLRTKKARFMSKGTLLAVVGGLVVAVEKV